MKWLKPADRDRFFHWLDSGEIPNSLYGQYYRLVLAVTMESGLRITEIVGGETLSGVVPGLTHGQFNEASKKWEGVLRLKRRNKVFIDAFLGPRSIRIYRDMFGSNQDPEEAIFPEKLERNRSYKWMRRLAERLGMHQDVGPHTMRHTLGRDISKKTGGDIPKIQKALGHASPATSMIYAEATDEEGIDAIADVRGDE